MLDLIFFSDSLMGASGINKLQMRRTAWGLTNTIQWHGLKKGGGGVRGGPSGCGLDIFVFQIFHYYKCLGHLKGIKLKYQNIGIPKSQTTPAGSLD